MKRSSIKEIRDQTQKCSVRLKALFMVPFPLPLCEDVTGESRAGLPPEPTGESKANTNPTESQRTKHKEKNAECALYRSELSHCGVAAWQVVSSNR